LAAPEILILARRLGVELVPFGAGLRAVGARDAITELAPHIAACKAELLHLLTEPSFDPDPLTVKTARPTRRTFGEWVETWRPLADTYHHHHFNCPICISAGKGYGMRCGAGASLWIAYSEAGWQHGAAA
jgi:hypothetical protein